MEEKLERLQKFLAEAGVASRRRAEELIAQDPIEDRSSSRLHRER